MSYIEPPEAKRIMQEISRLCSQLRMMLNSGSIPQNYLRQLAYLWQQYINSLPPNVRNNWAIAIFGGPLAKKYGSVIPLSRIPELILTDPEFAKFIIKVFGE